MVYITTQLLTLITFFSYLLTSCVTYMNSSLLIEWDMLNFSSTCVTIPIIIDPTSMIFMSTVLTIATSVMQFAKTYMINDKSMDRFIMLVLLFVMSMMFLVLFPHTIALLLGWDGLGITSFVLVIYYNNPKSLGAGMITALTNRIGDVMLLISIALMFNEGHWLVTNIWNNDVLHWTGTLIMIAAMTKSAQMPFSSWLPAAMAAPTPVSALVHSSTLVTAGVYLMYRFYPLMESMLLFKPIMMMVSTMTMLMASASAMAECDMKKIIALSTLSQVAVMMFTLSIGMPEIAFFHLITHALFKALLFICAGNMIDIHHHSQDLRLMGNTTAQLPSITAAITIANMALCGAPFMAGFYSKDLIIETTTMLMSEKNTIIMVMFIMATILTTAYSTRFSIYVLMNHTSSPVAQYSSEGKPQTTSIIVLTILAISGGAITNWLFTIPICEPNFSVMAKMTAPMMITSGLILGSFSTLTPKTNNKMMISSHCFMWFLTPISTHLMPKITMILPFMELKETDQGWSLIPSMLLDQLSVSSSPLMSAQNNSMMSHLTCATTITCWTLSVM
uniref:NADH-ubiquinone oxidoreductase chain 5 n=1 Tax=Platynereis cf. australis PA-2020 TaxID=2759233 RepID=A0A7G9UJ15_9ANNE|nr:NADH dehydrogenase subunit 5 [Platynereis cf. australis PA-2020]QNN93070.1 NADH dehydrogenase subunit 5 [Platynereis cf. australis PA-2020]QNN93096.1 NADH dehydrogenase subunit 5 [Platynereis cf. australis PA-2020]